MATASLADSITRFIRGESINTSVWRGREPPRANACKRCGSDGNYASDLLCRSCGRAPTRVRPIHWAHIMLFILAVQFAEVFPSIISGVQTSSLLFIWFAFALAIHLQLYVLRTHFPYASLLVWVTTFCVTAPGILYIINPAIPAAEIVLLAAVVLLVLILAAALFQGMAAFRKANNISWIIPFLVVLPVDLLILSYLLPETLHYGASTVTLSMAAVTSALQVLTGYDISSFIGEAGWWFSLSVEIRLLLIAGYIAFVAGVFGVMEAIKQSVVTHPLVFWPVKVGLTFWNAFRALKPMLQTLWVVNLAVLLRFGPALFYPTVLYLFYLLIHHSDPGFSWMGLVGLLLVIIGISILLPAFVHTACGYTIGYKEFYNYTFENMTEAHANLLLWTMFCLIIASFWLNGFRLDYPKAISAIFFMVGALGLLNAKVRQTLRETTSSTRS
jgi:hypothetical protein